MAFKVHNREKVVSLCPVGIRKSLCPSIQRTRQIRNEILRLQRMPDAPWERLEVLRQRLRDKKKAGIGVDCPKCHYNTAKAGAGLPTATQEARRAG